MTVAGELTPPVPRLPGNHESHDSCTASRRVREPDAHGREANPHLRCLSATSALSVRRRASALNADPDAIADGDDGRGQSIVRHEPLVETPNRLRGGAAVVGSRSRRAPTPEQVVHRDDAAVAQQWKRALEVVPVLLFQGIDEDEVER